LKKVDIYTDGSCKFNPGPGGWGAVLVYGRHERELCGGDAETTNNRMELTAAIKALGALKEPCRVHLCSDSKYLIDALEQGWAKAWREKGWRKPDKSPAQNADLWEELLALAEVHEIEYEWVKGHAGHPYNERCDAMAQAEADKIKEQTPERAPAPIEENIKLPGV